MKTPTSAPIAKRLVFVTGDKGGVGKSFTARTLVQRNLDMSQPCHAYDIDPVNPSLHQYYPENTIRLDLEEPGALDQIRNDLEFNSLLLVDCAARSLHELDVWFRELGLLRQRQDLRLAVTFVFVITPDKSCTAIMSEALDMFGHDADYLVVKNLKMGKDFSIYENSKLRKRLLEEYQGKEITLPPLLERTVVLLDRHDLGFNRALVDDRVTVADRSRVRGFLEQAYLEFDPVKERLSV
jgi:hypothetical protein